MHETKDWKYSFPTYIIDFVWFYAEKFKKMISLNAPPVMNKITKFKNKTIEVILENVTEQ